jgi:multidrug efflux pump subunit AcrA (membrane-fusion protein)
VYGPVTMTVRHFIFLMAMYAAAIAVTPQTRAQDDATLVQVDPVVREPLTQKFTVIGRLVARQHGEVAARIPGPVAEMRVQIGDRVVKGDIIAVIDRLRPTLRRDIAAAEVAASNAGLATAEARHAMARAGVGQAEARLTQARQELARIEKLRNSTAFSPARFDDQQQLVAAATSEVDFARATVREALSLIEQSRAAILRARATLKIADDDLRHTEVRAPFDGVVTLRHTEVGAFVETGSRVITLINDRDIEIEADVPFERLNGLTPGVEIAFRLDDGVPRIATVRAIGVEENSRTRTRPVRFMPLFDSDHDNLADGQSVTIDLPIGPPRDVVSVHKDAIVRNVTGAAVYVVVDGIAEHRLVSLGEAIGTRFEVLDGVTPGEVVVVRGNERLMPGQAVRFDGQS